MSGHAELLFAAAASAEIYAWIDREPPKSIEALRSNLLFLEGRSSKDGTEDWLNWLSLKRDTGDVVGRIEITQQRRSKTAFLAYTTFPPFWRQGFAKEGCLAVINHVFAAWSTSKVVINMDVRNTASVRLAESLGAVRVQFKPRAEYFKGRWSDEYAYEIEPR